MKRLPVWFERAENLVIAAAVVAAFVHLHFSWLVLSAPDLGARADRLAARWLSGPWLRWWCGSKPISFGTSGCLL